MADTPKRSSAASSTKQEEPAAPEPVKWFRVQTQNGNHDYVAADEKDAKAQHERTVPTDTIIDVVAL